MQFLPTGRQNRSHTAASNPGMWPDSVLPLGVQRGVATTSMRFYIQLLSRAQRIGATISLRDW